MRGRANIRSMMAANNVSRQAAAAGDPYFANVVSLLHFDTGNTTMTDVKGNTWTVEGNAIASGTAKYGAYALALDGSGDWIYNSSLSLLDSTTYTVEMWLYLSGGGGDRVIFDTRAVAGTGMVFFVNNSNVLQIFDSNTLRTASTTAITQGVYQHVAISVNSGSGTYYINGTSAGTFTVTATSHPRSRIGGRFDSVAGFPGLIDDFRITKGVARYTANFTPPTAAFPDA